MFIVLQILYYIMINSQNVQDTDIDLKIYTVSCPVFLINLLKKEKELSCPQPTLSLPHMSILNIKYSHTRI